jgi:cephalosporin-C deacetylase-like acetyl esterase
MSRSHQLAQICAIGLLVIAPIAHGQVASSSLPGTQSLTIGEPLDKVMVAGISRFAVSALEDSQHRRDAAWELDAADLPKYKKAVEARRLKFRTIVGAVDDREPANGFDIVAKAGHDGVVARWAGVTAYAIRWPVLPGVTGEALLLEPPGTPIARVIAIPDASWTPEVFTGLESGLEGHHSSPSLLAAAGVQVVVPTIISRDDTYSGNPLVAYTNQPHREFIYRQAFPLGRHIIGYEIEKIQAAVDQFEKLNERQNVQLPVGVMGVGEGGLLALYAAAIDSRIDAALVSGYFQNRKSVWKEPIYRNVWGLLTEFGDAEIAGMVAPRPLVIEACAVPEVAGPPPQRDGRRGGAAPGSIATCVPDDVRTEYARAQKYFARLAAEDHISLFESAAGSGPSGTEPSLTAFLTGLRIKIERELPPANTEPQLTKDQTDPAERQRRQVQELTNYTQRLMQLSPKVRDQFWAKADRSSVQNWVASTEFYRNHVWEEMIGKLPAPSIPPNVRTRRVIDDLAYTGYEVAIDIYPDVLAAGILLLPKKMRPDEKRPVVVCQHGLEGVSLDTIKRSGDSYRYYKAFADELAKQGFIVYAPQNPYIGGDLFRVIQRQSNPMKRSLYSYIIPQHERTLEWLATLPNVDAQRIAFYGLSYGGKTAMRVPPLLKDRYAMSICSADFNDWIRKMVSVDDSYGYVFTGEYEMPEWNMGHIASYAELASLMTPRPFMVERGHDDGVAPDEWVAAEFAKVRRHYDKLGLGDRNTIEFFNGPHMIHGVETYQFLHKQLNWPDGTRN